MESRGPAYLLVRFSSLGDVVLATAAARRLKESRPDARVVLATKAAFAPILACQPDLDEVWVLEDGGLTGLIRRARAARFDAVVDLHSSVRSRVFAALCGSPTVRWSSEGFRRRLKVWNPARPAEASAPVYVRYVQAADRALGAAFGGRDGEAPLPRLGLDPGAVDWAGAWLAAQGLRPGQKLLAVAPGAAWATKRWGVQHLAQCLDLVAEFDRVRFLLVGSRREAPLLDALSGALRKSRPLLLRADSETGDLRRLAALIARADHFLGHDSGPTHVAAALGLKVSVLFGPTVRDFGFFPAGPGHRVFERDLACRPCSVHGTDLCPLGHHDCMESIEPFDVAHYLRTALGLEAGTP